MKWWWSLPLFAFENENINSNSDGLYSWVLCTTYCCQKYSLNKHRPSIDVTHTKSMSSCASTKILLLDLIEILSTFFILHSFASTFFRFLFRSNCLTGFWLNCYRRSGSLLQHKRSSSILMHLSFFVWSKPSMFTFWK